MPSGRLDGGRSSDAQRTPWQCPQAAAGAHCRSRRVCMDGRRPATTVSRPCSGPAAVSAVSGSADTCWGSAPGPRNRRTATVRTLGQWTRLVDTGSRRRPALRTPATAAASCRPYGNGTLDSRRHHRPPPPRCPTRNGTARYGSGRHPPWSDRQIRSLVPCAGLVGSRRTWAAQVGRAVGRVGSRQESDRPDDQPKRVTRRLPRRLRRPANEAWSPRTGLTWGRAGGHRRQPAPGSSSPACPPTCPTGSSTLR
jgi:hypothetical protein